MLAAVARAWWVPTWTRLESWRREPPMATHDRFCCKRRAIAGLGRQLRRGLDVQGDLLFAERRRVFAGVSSGSGPGGALAVEQYQQGSVRFRPQPTQPHLLWICRTRSPSQQPWIFLRLCGYGRIDALPLRHRVLWPMKALAQRLDLLAEDYAGQGPAAANALRSIAPNAARCAGSCASFPLLSLDRGQGVSGEDRAFYDFLPQ